MLRGAVLVPILARSPTSIVFVERAPHLRRHPGQIAFPGGVAEEIDGGDPVKTALRELFEELGVGAEGVKLVDRLAELEQLSSELLVTPIVGVLDNDTCFSVDGEEIAGVFTVPLASILARDAVYEDIELSAARGRAMYALDHEGRHIWGFTARILKSFVDAWSEKNSMLRAAVEAACDRGAGGN
jgi:8-oxo-dGTP pyrophosphatase MutT (NUDIX family)